MNDRYEASLTDIIKIFIARKWLFTSVLLATAAASATLCYLNLPKPWGANTLVKYVTLYSVGRGPSGYLEVPDAVRLRARYSEIPEALRENKASINIRDGLNGEFVQFSTVGSLDQESEVIKVHRAVIEKIQKRHDILSEHFRNLPPLLVMGTPGTGPKSSVTIPSATVVIASKDLPNSLTVSIAVAITIMTSLLISIVSVLTIDYIKKFKHNS